MKHSVLYIGIDPGKQGGISAITATGEPFSADKMPETPQDLIDALQHIKDCCASCHARLEVVHSSPQMGVVSAFTFGRGYGRLETALAALHIPYDIVRPQAWQKELGCMSKGDKNVTKARAQCLFPEWRVTHAIADSLLIAEFCRRAYV